MSHPNYLSDLQSKQSKWEMSISELFKESSVLFWTEICLTLDHCLVLWIECLELERELDFFFCRSDIKKQLQQLLFPWKQNDCLLHSKQKQQLKSGSCMFLDLEFFFELWIRLFVAAKEKWAIVPALESWSALLSALLHMSLLSWVWIWILTSCSTLAAILQQTCSTAQPSDKKQWSIDSDLEILNLDLEFLVCHKSCLFSPGLILQHRVSREFQVPKCAPALAVDSEILIDVAWVLKLLILLFSSELSGVLIWFGNFDLFLIWTLFSWVFQLLQIVASSILSLVLLILGLIPSWNSFNFALSSELLTLRHGSEWLTCDFWNLNLCLLLFVIVLLFDLELMTRLSKLLDFCIVVWHWEKTPCGRLLFDSLRLASLHCSWEQISETLHLYSKGDMIPGS